MAGPWTSQEVDRVVDVYFSMLQLELVGERYSKTDFRNQLLDDVGRSKGSAEYKFQNVSAVLEELGGVFIDGYKPARNVQELLRERVTERFADAADLRRAMLRGVEAEPAAHTPVLGEPSEVPMIDPVEGPTRARTGRFVDFQKIEASNRALGLAGELAVVDLERRRLARAGRADLAGRVRHVSVEEGDGLGYDVLSWTPGGAKRLLEIKTTRYSPYQPFLVTENEVALSVDEPESFTLVRLFRFEKTGVGYYELPGPLWHSARLRPTVYQGIPALRT